MKKNFLFIVLLIIPFFANSQDTLYLKNGNKLPCKITNSDSINVYVNVKKQGETLQTYINKTKILEIKYHTPAPAVENNISMPKHVNSIYFSFGSSMPIGDFANDDINTEGAGLAGSGTSFNIFFNHQISTKFGFMIQGFYNTNEFKANKLTDMIETLVNLPVTNNTVNYNSYGLLVGPSLLMPVDKLSLHGHFLLGFANLTEPQTTFTVTSGSSSGWIKMPEMSASSFCLNIGAGLIYSLNDNWDLFSNIDCSQGTFKFDKYRLSTFSAQSDEIERGTQRYTVITLSVGLGLKF